MRVYITVDIEGVAGVVDFSQGNVDGGADYALGRRLMTLEANAAIEGVLEAGATEIVVNDGHAQARNIMPELLHPSARLIQGRLKPLGICEGLAPGFDAALAVGYHAPPGRADGILNHAYHPYELKVNDVVWDEVGLVAMVAGHFDIPLALVTGDDATIERSRELLPAHVGVSVKRGITRYGAESVHPEEAQQMIRSGAREALSRLGEFEPYGPELPVRVEETLFGSQQADVVALMPTIERVDARTVRYESPDALSAYRTFIATAFICQGPAVAAR